MVRKLFLGSLALALFWAPGGGQAQTAPAVVRTKAPEFRTALPPALSPALTAAQLAKQALTPAVAVAQSPVAGPGVKPIPAITALPLVAGAARHRSDAPGPTSSMWRAPMMHLPVARPDVAAAPGPKPEALSTARPLSPEQAAAEAQRQAHKLDHALPAHSPSTVRKPNELDTRGPAPAKLAPSQDAKRAQDASRRPR